ncbi:Eco57I restriction-modification methylase domain-containing protein, partial [Pseudomonas sp. GWSMS-1]|uniref:Eco57I restriction-modification methylase domain-containing protein n=1 Tax=Pseudomonas sp. GWSMS-1 TaxID=3308997 RepID=UPI003CF8D3B4
MKQAAQDDPVIFLGVGNQPALTLSQLEAMDDKAIKQLFEALKKKDKAGDGDGDGDGGDSADDSDPEVGEEADDEIEQGDEVEEEAEESIAEETEELTLSADHLTRAQAWLERAAVMAGLVKKTRGRRTGNVTSDDEQALAKAAKQLCARLVAPGQFYLVRWGGTRKGAGTFYTRPQLAAPTVRRTLQPLAFDAVHTEVDARTGLETVMEWAPKVPEDILALKVCDPAMGSGSFLAGALRYLTEALVQSLYHHQLIMRAEDGSLPRMADGKLAELLSDELTKLKPAHPDFEERLRAQLKRHIVENCLYGVDLDPLAVELGRMALWVETMDRDLPFGFLDHKLKVGNALVGTWFDTYRDYPAMAWQREGGDKDYQKNKPDNLINHFYEEGKGKKGDVFTAAINTRSKAVPVQLEAMLSGQLSLGNALDASDVHDELLKVFRKLHRLPVHESEKRADVYREEVLNNPHYHALKARMDLWCALWFWPGEQIEQAPLPRNFAQPDSDTLEIAGAVAQRLRFFHWELEFPDVFTTTQDGFDALLGNPPWEIQKPNSKEFFSNHDPLYRSYGKQEALSKQLEYFNDLPQLEHDWIAYNAGLKGMSNWAKYVGKPFGDRVNEDKSGKQKHDLNLGGGGRNSFAASAAQHKKWLQQRKQRKGFADSAHPFLHQGSADLNTYKLFLELSHALLRGHGRLGMIVPSGIYTDKGTAPLRELFLEQCDWQWLFGFENREGIFDIHRSFKFCPLILQKGGETQAIRAAFMHRNVDDWEQAERHVLAYPRERVLEFSPYSKAILEIRDEQDLRVLQKIYANGVLLGDQSERGWGIKYATEFHMTNDSNLFKPRPKWEEKGYQPDEYGHWLKGPWRDYHGPMHVLDREPGVAVSRDGTQALQVEQIEDVALPLYEGRMISQFDFSEKGWVSGKGRKAVWRDISFAGKVIEPQYLMGLADYRGNDGEDTKLMPGLKAGFLAIGSATNSRSMFSGLVANFPAGNSVAVLQSTSPIRTIALMTALNSFVYDFTLRNRLGGLNLNYFVIAETPVPDFSGDELVELARIGARLCLPNKAFAQEWLKMQSASLGWKKLFALTEHERLRLKTISEAICAFKFGLDVAEFHTALESCDLPLDGLSGDRSKRLNPKGFWRIDKDKHPELRHTVLSLVAFYDLQEKGLDAFLDQNNGEGWLIPDNLRLADYGLGHDERAQEYQPVTSRLGPRFYDWQLNEDVGRSWQECAAHAELIRRIVPLPSSNERLTVAESPDTYDTQG